MLTVFFESGWSVIALLSKCLRRMRARSSPYGLASCSPINRCSRLIALSGRTITLKCVIRLPSALKVMMSTPLILTPSISFSNSSTALVAAPFADIPEAGAAQHLSRARQVLERDLTPALRRVYDGALEHGVGMQQVPQRFMVVRLPCSRATGRGRSFAYLRGFAGASW